jgi:eukaryotic-like serine/threonine-protein kinase
LIGKTLGPFRITEKLGEGGMGEVYKARDTRLDRTVAIKVLPAAVASDADLRSRFEREARSISSLNHPNICTLFEYDSSEGNDFLVLEYIEGETLASRLDRGALKLDEALRIAVQIADALEAAHRRGIIHRDLKPGNIMLTKAGAKLLDFGLAKFRAEVSLSKEGFVPERTLTVTTKGTILGTIQYMAPEQLEGKDVDARSDIFALGLVIYEMVTGRKAFEGKSQASLIAAILERDPAPMTERQPLTPPSLERVVRACLAKDPDERWQSAADIRRELTWMRDIGAVSAIPSVSRVPKWERLAWGGAVFLLLAALIVSFFLRKSIELPQVSFDIPMPPQTTPTSFSISPDGRRIVFAATGVDGRSQLWLRPLDADESALIPGTEGATFPFWSPDSRFIAFFAQEKLKKMELPNGVPLFICNAANGRGGAWNADDVILFAPEGRSALYRVPASGGEPAKVTTLDDPTGEHELSHRFPQFLPDGDNFLFYMIDNLDASKSGVYAASLKSGIQRSVLIADTEAYGLSGFIITIRAGTLIGRRFDESRKEPIGDPIPLAKNVGWVGVEGRGAFSVSNSGVLIYRSEILRKSQFSWVDRSGKVLEPLGPLGVYGNSVLSPDGNRLALEVTNTDNGRTDIWIWDLSGGASTRVTTDPDSYFYPAWSPTGEKLIFKSGRNLYQQSVTGGEKQLLYSGAGSTNLHNPSFSPDGQTIVFENWDPKSNYDIFALPLTGDRKLSTLVKAQGDQYSAYVSPDGQWLVYTSNESGRPEIYAQGMGQQRGKYQISVAGGSSPRWSSSGKELYFINPEGVLMAVPVQAAQTWKSGPPAPLFKLRQETGVISEYLPAPDGRRFLLTTPLPETSPLPIKVILNWTARLKNK